MQEFAEGGAGLPGAHLEPEGQEERLFEAVMLRLRLADGLDLRRLASEHSHDTACKVWAVLQPHVRRNLVLPLGGSPAGGAGCPRRCAWPTLRALWCPTTSFPMCLQHFDWVMSGR